MLLAIDLYEDYIDVESVTVASMFSLQSSSVYSSEFDAPEADRFAADSDTAFSEKIFDISVAEIEAEVQPDGVADDIGRESMALVCIHEPILSKSMP